MKIVKFNDNELIIKTKYKYSGYVAFFLTLFSLFYSLIGIFLYCLLDIKMINYDGNQLTFLGIWLFISLILLRPSLNLTKTVDILYFNKKKNIFIHKKESFIKNTILKNNFNFITHVTMKDDGVRRGKHSLYHLYKINFYYNSGLYFSFDLSVRENSDLKLDKYKSIIEKINLYLK